MPLPSDRRELLALLHADRRLAHAHIFGARHRQATAEFHGEIIDDLHSPAPLIATMSFRGSAKSTLAEEAMLLMAGFREFHAGLILGASLPLAMQRLHAIRRQVEKNARLKALFGDLRGQPWTDDQLEFSNGVTIRAMGKGQALRGSKEEDYRPDFVLGDDMEDKESVRTHEGREKIQSWFIGEVIPAMEEPGGRARVLANMLDSECLTEKLKAEGSGWKVRTYPVEYKDPLTGDRRASWPDKFPLQWIDAKRQSFFALGRAREWLMEYMCVASADRERPFRQEMKRIEPRVRLWEAASFMIDPARTTGAQSATTGIAGWSWIGPRLTVWELVARKLMPSEIIDELFRINEQYRPVKIGFEADGLNEWALQPIRAEQRRRGVILPLVPIKAPTGKLDFIKALQVYFTAREVWLTQEFPEAWQQFLGFPAGPIDAPNALAYALHPKLRAGVPIYDDFGGENATEGLELADGVPAWLALNATGSLTTAVLCQILDDGLRVHADWVREDEPAAVLAALLREANLEAGRLVRPIAGPLHFDRWNNVGLAAAARRVRLEVRRGSPEAEGRAELRSLLRSRRRGLPGLLISSRARWTLNAFSGGYCRAMQKGGVLSDFAEEGVHRTLMEGLESFAGLLRAGAVEDDEERLNATTASGVRYHSARPVR